MNLGPLGTTRYCTYLLATRCDWAWWPPDTKIIWCPPDATVGLVITSWESLTKCQTVTFIKHSSDKLPHLNHGLHQLPMVGVDKYTFLHPKFQADHYIKFLSGVSVAFLEAMGRQEAQLWINCCPPTSLWSQFHQGWVREEVRRPNSLSLEAQMPHLWPQKKRWHPLRTLTWGLITQGTRYVESNLQKPQIAILICLCTI